MNEDKQLAVKVAILAMSLFLVIVCYSIVKPVRGALVVSDLGAASLPQVWIASSIVTGLLVMAYSKLLDYFNKPQVLLITSAFFGLTLLGIRLGMESPRPWLSGAFYVWGEVFSVMMVEQVWGLAADSFTTAQAKRCYGLITAGSVIGGVVGSALVLVILKYTGTRNLIYVCIACLVPLVAGAFFLKDGESQGGGKPEAQPASTGALEGFRFIAGSRYLGLIALLVLLNQVVSNLIDFQSNAVAEALIPGMDERTHFFGQIYMAVSVLSLVFSTAVAGPVMSRWGVPATLLVLPLGNWLGAAFSAVTASAASAAVLRVLDKSLNYSMQRASKEVLYIPVDPLVRAKAKSVIDMFVYRVSKLVGTLILLPLGASALGLVNTLNMILISAAAVVAWMAGREFMKAEKAADDSRAETTLQVSVDFV